MTTHTALALAAHAHHTAHGGASPVSLVLAGFAAAAAYLLSLYASPTRRCPRCEGTGAKRTSTGRPTGALCRRCRGTGRIRRIGATAVHRFYWSALGDRQRDHRRAAHAARQAGSPRGPQHPYRNGGPRP